jgi:glycosyltransferase 2 family protein
MTKGRAATVSMAVAAVLAAVLLFYSLSGVDWREVGRIAAAASPGRLCLAAVFGSATLLLRSLRWRILLNAEGAVRVSTAFWATAAGYFGNNFLPARAGELVRTLMISSRSGLDPAYVLATAVSERAADAVALVVIVGVVLPWVPSRPGWLAGAATSFAILGAMGVLAIAVLPRFEGLGRTLLERMTLLPETLRAKLTAILDHGLRGLRAFHDSRRLWAFLVLTVIIWSLDAVATAIGASALGFAIPMSAAFLLIASLGLGSALPSAPGYVGIYQFVAVTVLPPFGLSRTDAIAYILVAQALMYVVIAFWGSLGLWHYRRARRST